MQLLGSHFGNEDPLSKHRMDTPSINNGTNNDHEMNQDNDDHKMKVDAKEDPKKKDGPVVINLLNNSRGGLRNGPENRQKSRASNLSLWPTTVPPSPPRRRPH